MRRARHDRSLRRMNPRRLILTAAAAAACIPALAAPSGAEAATCGKGLDAPGDDTWEVTRNGTLDSATYFDQGSNFDKDQGLLVVNGHPYPAIPDVENACSTTASSIGFPAREIGGVTVIREVASIGGRIRWLDRLVNDTAAPVVVDVGFELRVLPSQVSVESETGDAAVTAADHWSVHQNDGGSHPFLQWGQGGDGAHDPSMASYGDQPGVWTKDIDTMPDAGLRYKDLAIPAHTQIRLLHMGGTTSSVDASVAAAKDTATPFTGLTGIQASTVRNWGHDPDGDGVGKYADECPAVKGSSDKGCLEFQAKPVDPNKEDPKPEDPKPQDAAATDGTTTPAPGTPPAADATPQQRAALDATAPRITLTKLPRKARRSLLTGRGLAPRIACDEACSITVRVAGRSRGRRKAGTVLRASRPVSGVATTVRLKLSARRIRRLARKQVTVVITATDAAGNRRTLTRVVRIAR